MYVIAFSLQLSLIAIFYKFGRKAGKRKGATQSL